MKHVQATMQLNIINTLTKYIIDFNFFVAAGNNYC